MHLKPEDLAVGKENFFAAIGSNARGPGGSASQREFLMARIQDALAVGGLPGHAYFGYDATLEEPIRVGVLGTGDQGSVQIGAINPTFVQVKAIADIRPYNQYRAFHGDIYSEVAAQVRPGLMKKYGWVTEEEARKNVKVYNSYQELLANAKEDGLEAVIIAMPLHLHAPAAIAAMKAGLHVLTEKLMGHSVRECKEMARAAKQFGKHLATGHQRHYNILYSNAVDLIRRGVLGNLHYIRAQWHRGNLPGNDSWRQPMPRGAKPKDDLAGRLEAELTSWERKLKSLQDAKKPNSAEIEAWAKKVAQKKAQIADEAIAEAVAKYGYVDRSVLDANGKVVYECPAVEELIRWRLWDRTGGGLMAELGSHQLDAASIFVAAAHDRQKQYPLSVAAASNRPLFPPDRDVDDHVFCLFEYPGEGYDAKDPLKELNRVGVQYASINGNGYGGYGETVLGTEGTLQLMTEKEAMLWRTAAISSKTKVVYGKRAGKPVLQLADDGDPESAAIGQMAMKDADRGYQQQIEHWAWCIRKNPDTSDPDILPCCHPKVAMGDAVIALTTNKAAQEGMRVEFKKEWFDPESDALPENELLGTDVKPDLSRYE